MTRKIDTAGFTTEQQSAFIEGWDQCKDEIAEELANEEIEE